MTTSQVKCPCGAIYERTEFSAAPRETYGFDCAVCGKEAAMSDMLEIEAAKIAQQKGNATEKTFAAQMITDHTKTSSELKGMVSGDMKAALPNALDDSSQKKLDKLRDAKPEDFAAEYDPMQVSAHKDATSLFERYAKGGDDPKLKDWAGQTLPALQHHLEMAQDMNKNRK